MTRALHARCGDPGREKVHYDRFVCACCSCFKPGSEKRRQMMFVPVDVCTGCVSRMEKPS